MSTRWFSSFAIVAGTAVLLLTAHARVGAITYGSADTGNLFPNVGAFIVKAPATGHIFPICSGTLIAPDVFLTASHCTAFFEHSLAPRGFTAWVSFDASIPFGALTTPATNLAMVVQVVTNPGYNQRQSDPGDIAVLLLSAQDTQGLVPAVLPAAGLLDARAARRGLKGTVYPVVGYGVQDRVVGGGVPYFQDVNPVPRLYAVAAFDALTDAWLRLSQNPATGNGGACFGDSGGPNFLGDSMTVAAVTSFGINGNCAGTGGVFRLDKQDVLDFIDDFMAP